MKKYYVLGKQKTNTTAVCIFMNNEGKYLIEEAETTKVGLCNFINTALKKIPNNETIAPEMSTIYVADVIGKAVSNGTIGNWIRDKKAGTGNVLTESELTAAKAMYIELGKKNLNVRILPTSGLSKDATKDTDSKNSIKRCWAILDRHQLTSQVQVVQQQVVVNPNQAAIDQITAQIIEAATKGEIEKMNLLNTTLQMLQGATPVSATATQTTPPATTVESNTNEDIMDFSSDPTVLDINVEVNSAEDVEEDIDLFNELKNSTV